MSKIGRTPIQIPDGVKLEKEERNFQVIGPKGTLELSVPRNIEVEISGNQVQLSIKSGDKQTKSLYGLWRMLIYNSIVGVSTGWQKKLDFKGVGYKAEVQDRKLVMNLGFNNPVEVTFPEDIEIEVQKNVITVSGIDKQKVGQVAANIRSKKPVEPYKGKGIKYIDEIPLKKPGKAAKAAIGTSQ